MNVVTQILITNIYIYILVDGREFKDIRGMYKS